MDRKKRVRDAASIADKYISRSGAPAATRDAPARTRAELAWRENAEIVHPALRKHLRSDPGAGYAVSALERIGDAIAIDEEDAARK
jgi:hypothetical protein